MGVDILACKKVTPLADHNCTEEQEYSCYEIGHREAYCYKGFERSLRGLPIVGEEEWRGTLVTVCGWVQVEGQERVYGWSYSGYNRFREALSRAALEAEPQEVWDDPGRFQDGPFFELVHFADNEGAIGAEACADLARDFDDWAERVLPGLSQYDRDGYIAMRDGFHLAAGAGMVWLG